MKNLLFIGVILTAFIMVSCDGNDSSVNSTNDNYSDNAVNNDNAGYGDYNFQKMIADEQESYPMATIFATIADGSQEVPAVESNGIGFAIFRLNRNESAMSYKVYTFNTQNVIFGHIHIAPRGSNGPVAATIIPNNLPDGITVNGLISSGTLTNDDLVGPLAGKTIAELADELRAGNGYANIHTLQVRSGEIRGQISSVR